jgi:hypothetical protein
MKIFQRFFLEGLKKIMNIFGRMDDTWPQFEPQTVKEYSFLINLCTMFYAIPNEDICIGTGNNKSSIFFFQTVLGFCQ